LRDLLDIRGRPVLVDACRYQSAIPQYHVGHGDKVSRLREMVSTLPGVHLVGNYLEGVSVNDCVRLGTTVAKDMIVPIDDRSSLPARRAPTTPGRAAVPATV
jgi:oxygen-dependent protoporphyrinogen oxidase